MYFADTAATTTSSSSILPQILLIVLFIGVFYFLLIRPMKRRQTQAATTAAQMRKNLGAGDQIVTIGGLYGTVVETDDESVTLEISPGVHARYDRNAVARIISESSVADLADETADEDDDPDLDTTANSVIDEKD